MMEQEKYNPPTVRFENVTKRYRLGSGQTSLRELFMSLPQRVFKKGAVDRSNELVALDQASFEIRRGESVGLIGPNGSGKTTSLKLLSSITRASSGTVWTNGRVSALIELGAGFHPDLSGRENIYFNAAILGMRQQEIRDRFDAIVEFSGLERFLDTPVKRYSSGMYCRLGFAVAAHVNPDILLVDEVLAVGDAVFQAKCLKRLSELRGDGTTIVFVTHNLGYLQRLCSRAIFLNKGRILEDGQVSDVIQAYRDHAAYPEESQVKPASGLSSAAPGLVVKSEAQNSPAPVAIADIYFTQQGERVTQVQTGSRLEIHVAYTLSKPLDNASFEIWLYGMDGAEYTSFATTWDGLEPLSLNGSGEVTLQIDPMCLLPGTYFVNVAISDSSGLTKYDMHWERHRVTVLSGPIAYGVVYLPHQWKVNETRIS